MPLLSAAAAIRTETVDYRQGDTLLEGYLAYENGHDLTRSTAYDARADHQSWAAMKALFQETLGR